MDNRRKSVIRTMKALAVACCFVVGALPLGQIPNFVGRCGKSLCHCPHESKKQSEPLPQKSAGHQRYLTLTASSITSGEDTLTLQTAFSWLTTPAIPASIIVIPALEMSHDHQHTTTRPPGYISELPTPPPRATA